jgi:hypothetical protein
MTETWPPNAWRDASNAKRMAALNRDDTRADLTRRLLKQFRAGEITRDECISRSMEIARMVFNRPDPEITDDDAAAAHRAFLELEITARGMHPRDQPGGSQ